jgi:hypothetical protein
MISDDSIKQAVEAGEKNQRTAELVFNWCAHARIKRFGGGGMIEQMYGVPIGHMGLECAHAPAGGMQAWDLENSALVFYDDNCVNCTHRQPVRLPNLTKLVAEREERRRIRKLEQDRIELEVADDLAKRDAARAQVRAQLDAVAASNLDLLASLDRERDAVASATIIKVAEMAPETFPPPLVEYLFATISENRINLSDTSLQILARLPGIDPTKLVNAALASHYGSTEATLPIIEANAAAASDEFVGPAVGRLVSLATVSHGPFMHDRQTFPAPLLQIYRYHSKAVREALSRIIGSSEAYSVGLAARGLLVLVEHDPSLTGFMTDDLLAKLARAKWLVKGDDDGVRDALSDIRKVLVKAFYAAPKVVDISIQQYLAGASAEGINALHRLYSDVLYRNHFDGGRKTIGEAERIAFKRLITATSQYGTDIDDDRFDVAMDSIHMDVGDLAPLIVEEIDFLLGTAAIILDKLKVELAKPQDPKDPSAFYKRMGIKQRLEAPAQTYIRWACQAASGAGADAIEKVLSFYAGLPEENTELKSPIIGQFSDFAENAEGLKLCLPYYYSAMVGPSQLLRSYAATALGELSRQALENTPGLVFEAFVALMTDPFVVVHRAAVRALERFSLPDEVKPQAKKALSDIILYYAKARDDDAFLVTAVEIFAHRYVDEARLAGKLGDILLDILMTVEPEVILRKTRYGLPIFSQNPNYIKLFLKLLNSATSEYDIEALLNQLDRRPPTDLKTYAAELAKAGVHVAHHRLYEVHTIIETLTACGAWSDASAMLTEILESYPDNMHYKSRRLLVQRYRISCDVEATVAMNDSAALTVLAKEWSDNLAEQQKYDEENRPKDRPLGRLFGTD